MKITIEGEPKEIADFEQALKDGKETIFNQTVRIRGAKFPSNFNEKANEYAAKTFR